MMRSFPFFLLVWLALAGCSSDEGIAADGCESIQDAFTCRKFGCTPTCGIVFLGYDDDWNYECQARTHTSLCLSVLPWSEHDHTNNADQQAISPGEEIWTCKAREGDLIHNRACFRFRNERDVPVGLVHYRNPSTMDWEHTDPCLQLDPDESLAPWEGACSGQWLTEDFWDDIIER